MYVNMQCTIPQGAQEGFPFQLNTPSGPMMVTVPPGCKPGMSIVVKVPEAPMVIGTLAKQPEVIDRSGTSTIAGDAMLPGYDVDLMSVFQKKELPGVWKGKGTTFGCIFVDMLSTITNPKGETIRQ